MEPLQINTTPNSLDKKALFLIGGLAFMFFVYFFLFSAPSGFPEGEIINIPEGVGLARTARVLKDENVIRSSVVLQTLAVLQGGEKHIIPGDYLFEKRERAWSVARRLIKGETHLAATKVTIPEGFTAEEMAEIFNLNLLHLDKKKFELEAKKKQGYLFPDTYFFPTDATQEEIISAMGRNYENKIAPLRPLMKEVGKEESEIIIMASIIEAEANGREDREFISGILWKRLSIGMALQADAAPETYQRRGLPASPIGNPGLDSIKAAIYPKSSPYLYYLHDKEGSIHYAKSFEEHKANKAKYLRP